MKGDLGQSFEKLKNEMFITINNCSVERLPDHQFKWGEFIGTLPEIGEKIREAGIDLKNSIKK